MKRYGHISEKIRTQRFPTTNSEGQVDLVPAGEEDAVATLHTGSYFGENSLVRVGRNPRPPRRNFLFDFFNKF